MAYVLSLRPHSPLKRSFSDNPYLQSCSPLKESLLGPLSDITTRNTSACSLYTLGSSVSNIWNYGSENKPPLTSQSLLNLVPEKHDGNFGTQHTEHGPRKRNCGADRTPLLSSRIAGPSLPYSRKGRDIQLLTESSSSSESSVDTIDEDDSHTEESELFNLYNAIHVPLPKVQYSENGYVGSQEAGEMASFPDPAEPQPFRRWMSTLRRRHLQRRKKPERSLKDTDENLFVPSSLSKATDSIQRKPESVTSSMGFVTTVKSTSITIGSASIDPTLERGPQGKARLGNRSSNTEARRSVDSHRGGLGPVIDESAWLRSLQRRKIVEELIASEEGYIADLKVLINDYFMILTALPALPGQTRSSIQQNISQILLLHEDLLSELQQAVPRADFTRSAQEAYPVTKARHIRFHSADILPGRLGEHRATRRLRHSLEIGRSPDRRPQGLVTDTKTVSNIAKVFNRHMKRFFTYEEYGAHWTTMSSDLTTMCKGLHGWQDYERGVEALQKVIASENNRESGSKKALSFPDLLIKPIQRTPVCDDPEAHAELEKALFRLQETVREVNKAKDDPKTRRLIEITWQLQDRLVFQEQVS
ncbi:hypothetical protein N0V94_002417 [Neodidymelliopsis sp. IMI 364377]|nr:hypothetical protein N0V94_002417 [Neodidymelliopsis sp. IMI 364377]